MTLSTTDLTQLVLGALTEIAPDIDPGKITPTTDLRQDLDLDSMDFLAFSLRLGQALGVELREVDYPEMRTLPGCVTLLQRKQAEQQPQPSG